MKTRTLLGLAAAFAVLSAHATAQCGSATPDAGEPVDAGTGTNDFCTDGSLPSIAPGMYTDFYIETNRATNTYIDEDFFTIDVPDGETITVDIFFIHALADTDLFLYDAAVHSPCTALTTNLAQGFSVTNDENVTWTNNTGGTVTTIIRVNAWTGHNGSQDCNTYDMNIDVTGGGGPVTYCGQNSANSVGPGATIAVGTSSTPGNLVFDVTGLPDPQPGVLFYGTAQVSIPFGCGTRCVGGTVVRFGPMFSSGGMVSYDVAVPSGSNVQFWYRDPNNAMACGDVFNLSDAVALP